MYQKVIIELSNWEMSDEITQTKCSLTNPTILSLFLKLILSAFYELGFVAFAFGLELQSGPSLFSERSGPNDFFFFLVVSPFPFLFGFECCGSFWGLTPNRWDDKIMLCSFVRNQNNWALSPIGFHREIFGLLV